MSPLSKLLERKQDFFQFVKFSLVGVSNSVITYVIYYVLLQVGVSYPVSSALGLIAGVINSYFFNKNFTFKSKTKNNIIPIKFLIVSLAQYFIGIIIIGFLVKNYSMTEELAGLISIGLCIWVSFFGHKFWTFKGHVEK